MPAAGVGAGVAEPFGALAEGFPQPASTPLQTATKTIREKRENFMATWMTAAVGPDCYNLPDAQLPERCGKHSFLVPRCNSGTRREPPQKSFGFRPSCRKPGPAFQTPPVRPARLATIVSSSAGSTGLDTCIWKPARIAFMRSSARA